MATVAFAQNPDDVTFTLATRDGRTTFRMGEAVTVEFRFQTSTPERYRIATSANKRVVRIPLFERFTVEPKENTEDPLRDIPAQFESSISSAGPAVPQPLGASPAIVERDVNEWISFRKPGHYRITAETTRLSMDAPAKAVPVRSNTIEIDVVAPEPGWAAAQLKEAVATLERWDPTPPKIGQVFDMKQEGATAQAARVLRFLETSESAPALARFFEHGPPAAQPDLRAGLFGNPYRREVIRAMEADLNALDVPITYYYLATLMELVAGDTLGPQPTHPGRDPEAEKRWMEAHRSYLDRTKPIETEYFTKLANAIERKRGQARAVSLETLILRGPQPAPPSSVAALIENFRDLPAGKQEMLLTTEWPRLASPSIEPFLRSMAEGSGPARNAALMRLHEYNPELARRLTIERIRKGDIAGEMGNATPRALLMLPDKTLPELDEAIVNAWQLGKPVDLLIARYASDAVFGSIQSAYERRPYVPCGGPIFSYFFRVEPAYAANRLAQARQSDPGGCALYMSPNEDLLMNPGLERAAIDDLANPSPTVRRTAQTLLQYAGSPQAENALWVGLESLRTGKLAPIDYGVEFGFADALLRGAGWVLTPDKVDRLVAACITDSCREYVTSQRRSLNVPLNVTLLLTPGASDGLMVGPFLLRNREQFESKLKQFPRGTQVRLGQLYKGTWFGEQRTREIGRILESAGMDVVQ